MADYTVKQIRAVRLLIPDTEAIFGDTSDQYMFEDTDIEIFLDEGLGNSKWAAGLASYAIGGSEALIGKWIRNYETQTNGAALQKEWSNKGKLLCDAGKEEVDEGHVGFFEIAFPEWAGTRHPEGYSHGGYRMPTPYQW